MPSNPKEYYPPMHTAEHILNQTMIRIFGTERSFSNHIERRKSKCDYHFNRNLTENELCKLEDKINNVIEMNLDVTEELLNIEEANKRVNLDRLPQNHENIIRIVNIGDFDSCPCSGVHVKNTSEIGKVKIVSSSFTDNVLRIRFKLQK
jgi:Ser-tRNA(Ala) deacylase AlaX